MYNNKVKQRNMPVTIAVTHKMNIANFDKFVIDIGSFGAIYNPSREATKKDNLIKLNGNIKAADAAETASLMLLNNAKHARADSFNIGKDLMIRTTNYIRGSEMPDNIKENFISISNKFLGRDRAAKKQITSTDIEGKTVVTETTPASTHQDMESKLAYFDAFIKQLSLNTIYNPNEANLKIANLTAVYNDMKTKRTAELTAASMYSNAQLATSQLLYADSTGALDLVTDVKQYVKAVFGTVSQQYKTLTALKFKKLKRK